MRGSQIDDVRIGWPKSGLGPPILFTNIEIRRMLRLAGTRESDVFYDLGCGWAQNLLVAASEFGVKKCVGIERDERRHLKARRRVRARSLSHRIKIIRGNFEDLVDGDLDEGSIEEATILFYGLSTSAELLDRLSERMRSGCRLVYYYNTLFPEIKGDRSDFPFYVSIFPFKRPVSELDWLNSIIQKKASSLIPGGVPSTDELWEELTHDYDYLGLRGDARKYRERLRRSLRLMNP